ncbi:MAG: cell division protein ZapE [Rhodococcus sp. (in: high G+C Gram-positive bacteria)]
MRPAATPHAFEASFELDAAQTAAVDLLTQPDALGVYMWGPVGRGKTWILDRYFTGVDIDAKKRVHFHNFFADLHSAYFRQRFSIDHAIDEVLGECRLLCFDEFHVHDIGDGTLIARMLDTLFARGTALVVTSNYPPDGLLPNPLFHEKFEPTIEVLKAHLREIRVDGPIDYRSAHAVRRGFAAGTWTVETELENTDTEAISFAELCTAPRSSSDYLALTEGLTIRGIPKLHDTDAESVQRFSNLVDILYDGGVATHFRASVDLVRFGEGCTGIDIDRMLSRLSTLSTLSSG